MTGVSDTTRSGGPVRPGAGETVAGPQPQAHKEAARRESDATRKVPVNTMGGMLSRPHDRSEAGEGAQSLKASDSTFHTETGTPRLVAGW